MYDEICTLPSRLIISRGKNIVIEIVYKNEDENLLKDENIKLPKNIRQIGNGNSDYQIYVEDNVMNYLKKVPTNESDIRYGVLLGTVKKAYGYTYVFVNGAIDVEDIVENAVIFSDEIWTNLNDNIHRYFRNVKIVGWFTSLNYQNNNDMPYITKVHLDNFAGNDKIYLKLDRMEDEENFYVYGSNSLLKLPGYHIFFEKNMDMEDYMYGSNIQSRFLKEQSNAGTKKSKTEQVERIKSTKSTNENNVSNKSGTNYSDMNISLAQRMAKNIASVLLVLALIGTIAVATDDKTVKNIKAKLMQVISSNSGDKNGNKNDIPVNGIINEPTELTTKENDSTGNDSTGIDTSGNKTTELDETTKDGGNVIKIEEVTTGQIAQPPTQEETTSTVDPTMVTASAIPNEKSYYIVEKGDTLYKIAVKLYNDPDKMNDIIALNNIEDINYVVEGRKLLLP